MRILVLFAVCGLWWRACDGQTTSTLSCCCPDPPLLSNGDATGQPPYWNATTITYDCHTGYQLDPPNWVGTCNVSDGDFFWSPTDLPVCNAVKDVVGGLPFWLEILLAVACVLLLLGLIAMCTWCCWYLFCRECCACCGCCPGGSSSTVHTEDVYHHGRHTTHHYSHNKRVTSSQGHSIATSTPALNSGGSLAGVERVVLREVDVQTEVIDLTDPNLVVYHSRGGTSKNGTFHKLDAKDLDEQNKKNTKNGSMYPAYIPQTKDTGTGTNNSGYNPDEKKFANLGYTSSAYSTKEPSSTTGYSSKGNSSKADRGYPGYNTNAKIDKTYPGYTSNSKTHSMDSENLNESDTVRVSKEKQSQQPKPAWKPHSNPVRNDVYHQKSVTN